ncbi:MAG TPA: 60S ribosomal export protein NMD3 [Methanomicrobiales archaeon]|nr:60S ribosomal export protein NMD3 [Methanomicrobiales archaeon]
MSIRESICPLCGEPSEGDLCGRCRAGRTRWMEVSPRAECITCPTCGSRKAGAAWQDSPVPRDELARELAIRAVRLAPEVRETEFRVDLWEKSPNRTIATVRVRAKLFGIHVEDEARVEILWRGETCDRCSRISGGYFEGVVQVRADGRAISPREREVAARIASEVEERLLERGARLSFISRMTEEEGLDIIVGENAMGEEIAREVTGALGGRYTVHTKLAGEKDGRRVYRITYSVRLPRLQKGDVIEADGEYLEVRETGKRQLKVFRLGTGGTTGIPHDTPCRLVGNVREAVPALIAFTEAGVAGILDPGTFATREVRVPGWVKAPAGSRIRVLPDRAADRLVIVG